MKDPAVLFYFQDFLVGTEFMEDAEVGKYIRVLCHLADKGVLTPRQLSFICRGDVPLSVLSKLKTDDDGNFYQQRMRTEREKRMSYSESRRQNRIKKSDNICKTYDQHMENENEDDNTTFKKGNKGKVKSKEFYLAEREKTENTSFHFFVDYLLGKNELNRPFSKILNMKDPIGHLRFEELQTLAAEHNTKIMDKVRGIENHKTQYASFNLTLTNWIKKENNVR